MTEQEWMECDSPGPLLEAVRGQASQRKLRLFGCACCRRVWELIEGEALQRAVEVAECFAEGQSGKDEMRTAYAEAHAASVLDSPRWYGSNHQVELDTVGHWHPAVAVASEARSPRRFAWLAVYAAYIAARHAHGELRAEVPANFEGIDRSNEERVQAGLVRCIFGSPFHCPVINSVWLRWNGRTVPRLARATYTERLLPSGELDPAHLAVLADALEDAGCSDATILSHLRSASPHYRGCWVIDLLLGKE